MVGTYEYIILFYLKRNGLKKNHLFKIENSCIREILKKQINLSYVK